MGGSRAFTRKREFLVCVDTDGACLAPSGESAAFSGAAQALAELSAVADVVVWGEEGAAVLRAAWNQWHLPQPRGAMSTAAMGKAAALGKLLLCGYQPAHVLVLGATQDALAAAETSAVLYYPILAGRQATSWQRLLEEAIPKFLHGSFAGDYQKQLIAAQQSLLRGQ